MLVGAFVNLSAVVASVKDEPRIDILCAGTDGSETREDILAAGAMVDQLCDVAGRRLAIERRSARGRASEWQQLLNAARSRPAAHSANNWRSNCATRPAAAT